MTVSIYDNRKSGDRSPFSTIVDLGSPASLGGAGVTFTLKTLDMASTRIAAATATATDVSALEGAEEQTVWRLEYTPTLAEVTVDVSEDYVGRFTVTYAGAQPRHYPPGGAFIYASINRA